MPGLLGPLAASLLPSELLGAHRIPLWCELGLCWCGQRQPAAWPLGGRKSTWRMLSRGWKGGILPRFYLALDCCCCCRSCCLFVLAAYKHRTWQNVWLLWKWGLCLRMHVSRGIPVLLWNGSSCIAFPWSWVWTVSLCDCQVLPVWEENQVTGENSLTEASLYLPLEEVWVKCQSL